MWPGAAAIRDTSCLNDTVTEMDILPRGGHCMGYISGSSVPFQSSCKSSADAPKREDAVETTCSIFLLLPAIYTQQVVNKSDTQRTTLILFRLSQWHRVWAATLEPAVLRNDAQQLGLARFNVYAERSAHCVFRRHYPITSGISYEVIGEMA